MSCKSVNLHHILGLPYVELLVNTVMYHTCYFGFEMSKQHRRSSLTRRAQTPGSQFGVEQHRAATRTSRSSRHSGRPADQRRLSATEWCNEALYHRASADLSDAAHDDQ